MFVITTANVDNKSYNYYFSRGLLNWKPLLFVSNILFYNSLAKYKSK